MTGFIAHQPTPEPSPLDALPTLSPPDGFWPTIHLVDVRKALRIDGTVTSERLIHAASAAYEDLCTEADSLRILRISAGESALSDRQAALFQRALVALTGAELIERYRSFDSSAKGHAEADALEPTIDTLRRDARWAIRDLLGQPRTTVELI